MVGLLIAAAAPVQGQSSYYASRQGGGQAAAPSGGYVPLSEVEDASLDLSTVITVRLEEVTLEEALRRIAQEADIALVYGTEKVAVRKRVSLSTERITAREAFQEVLRGTGLRLMRLASGQLVVVDEAETETKRESQAEQIRKVKALVPVRLGHEAQQVGTIAGTVTDSASGAPLPGVNVVVEGTQQGASTDAQGQYALSGVEAGTYTLVASFVGYAAQTVEGVGVADGETVEVNFALRQSVLALDEVVAVGYGQQERTDVTGAISSVQAEDIERASTTSLDQVLQGRVAGVTVSPNSGQPGAPIDVNVRGIGSFGNSNPLYVIDGVPISNDINEAGVGQSNPLALISTENIESIEVLKDASATAIYGARGANGVVLITTKQGVSGDMQVNFSSSYGMQQVTRSIAMANSQQYAEVANDADDAAGNPRQPALNDPEILSTNTNWQEAAYRSAPVMSHNLSISGGGEDIQYLASGTYLDEEGILVNSGFKRYSAQLNTTYDLSSWIRIGETLNLSRGNWWGGYDPGHDWLNELIQSSPTLPVHCPENEGGFCGPSGDVTGRNRRHNRVLVWSLRQNEKFQNRVLGNAFSEVDLIPGLTYRLDVGLDFLDGDAITFMPTYEAGTRTSTSASLAQFEQSERMYLLENTLSYDKTFANAHTISTLAGYTQQSTHFEFLNGNIQDFPSNDLRVIEAGTGPFDVSGNASEWALRSFLARLNYSYADKYLLTATFRRDGSSRFGSENRWGNFPSFSLGWTVSEEPFMDNVSFIDQLKIRGSWGKTGSQSTANYAAYTNINSTLEYALGGSQASAPGSAITSYGNQSLKWEVTTQTDIGLDLRLFSNHLDITADYYVKDISDVLLQLPVATTSGVDRNNGPFRNAAGIRNSGLELSANYTGTTGGVQYSVGGNISTFNNEVTSLGGGVPIFVREDADPQFVTTYTAVGGEIGSFYGYVMDGLFQTQEEIEAHATQIGAAPGDIRFEDLNDDGVIDGDDRRVIGSPIPDFSYGFDGNFAYNDLDLSFSAGGTYGNEIYNVLWGAINEFQGDNNVTLEGYDNYWRGPGTSNTVPRAVAGDPADNDRPSTRFVEDGSYLRLRNLQVGYTFDNLPSLGLETEGQVRVYLGGKNLFTLSSYRGYNPDIGSTFGGALLRGIDLGVYPIGRQFTAGVQLTGF